MQTVLIELAPGESVYCQTHAMAWMTDMSAWTPTPAAACFPASSARSAEQPVITTYTANGPGASRLAFAPAFRAGAAVQARSGRIGHLPQETFLVAQTGVTFEIAFQQRLGAAFSAARASSCSG